MGMQTRDDAWILNQIKTVRSDRSGEQLSWSRWINEALASFRMPDFCTTWLIAIHFLELPLYHPPLPLCRAQKPRTPPCHTHSSATTERAISVPACFPCDLGLMQRRAAFRRTFWVFSRWKVGIHGTAEGESGRVPVRGCQMTLSKSCPEHRSLTTWASVLCASLLAVESGSTELIYCFTPILEI